MATVTAQVIIDGAYDLNNISAPSTADRAAGLILLNDLIGLWSADGLLVPYKTIENFPLVASQAIYTIGASGNFDTVWPLSIVGAYIRDSASVDYQLGTMSKDRYNSITTKSTSGRPTLYYYDPQYPKGKIYFNLTPSAVETLYIDSWKGLTELATTGTSVDLPDYYKKALKYNLAVDLSPVLGSELSPLVVAIASDAKEILKDANAPFIKEMRFDTALRIMA